MELDSGTKQLIPLPELSHLYGSDLSPSRDAGFRRFGIFKDDLGFDFGSPNRAAIATKLLDHCTVDPDRALPKDFYRDMSIGKRIECLIVLALGGDDALRFPFKCSGCGEELELEMTIGEIAEMQREADGVENVSVELSRGRTDFRRVAGRDQEKLVNKVFLDDIDAAAEIISTIAVGPALLDGLDADDLERVEAAMADADPLVDFQCRIECGECGQLNDREIDLFETALDMLSRAQRRLVLSVHRLAAKYHWSEQEIFAVPEWRRRQYLELIGAKL